jgi:VanZ family protein
MRTRSPRLAAAALAVAAGISLAATLWPRRFKFIERTIPSSDKAGHFLVMGLLAAVLVWALAETNWRGHRLTALGCLAGTLLLVTLEEVSQLALPTRTFSWLDLAYSWAGVLVLGGLAGAFVRYSTARAERRRRRT